MRQKVRRCHSEITTKTTPSVAIAGMYQERPKRSGARFARCTRRLPERLSKTPAEEQTAAGAMRDDGIERGHVVAAFR